MCGDQIGFGEADLTIARVGPRGFWPYTICEKLCKGLKLKGKAEIKSACISKPKNDQTYREETRKAAMIRLGEDKKKWAEWLTAMGLPKHSSSTAEILEHRFPDIVGEDGKRKRPIFGERAGDESLTMSRGAWFALFFRDEEDVVLPAEWQHYLQYMDVIPEYLYPKNKGANLKRLALQDARSRRREPPTKFPAELGTPE